MTRDQVLPHTDHSHSSEAESSLWAAPLSSTEDEDVFGLEALVSAALRCPVGPRHTGLPLLSLSSFQLCWMEVVWEGIYPVPQLCLTSLDVEHFDSSHSSMMPKPPWQVLGQAAGTGGSPLRPFSVRSLALSSQIFVSRDSLQDNIADSVIRAIQPYIDSEEFQPAAIAKVSKACTSICQWVRAMHKYHFVAKIVEPKRVRGSVSQLLWVLRNTVLAAPSYRKH